ncbi:phosphate ABC transporter substrate-binding protein [Gemmatimonas sp.]|uniref:phosphate ABC transporter substrate-binding protein n=1 Tax=Gemmatimonas sp. TaxID=1962908 RepID=UPI0033403F09
MTRFFKTVAFALVAVVAAAVPAQAQDFKVIVNSANSTSDLTAEVAAKLFLKQTSKFPNGTSAQPVDLGKASPVRAAFSKAVLSRPVPAVETYWQQQIFSGKDVPPAAKASDDDVIAFVKANPGAIGYVSAGASTAGVKVIDVK